MLEDLEGFEDHLKLRVKSWGTRNTYMCTLGQLSSFLDGNPLTEEAAREFLNHKKQLGASVSTLYSYMLILRQYFKWRGEPAGLNCPEITQARAESSKEYYRANYLTTDSGCVRAPGKRPRPRVCELCGVVSRLEYHHWDEEDFSKGLWLCWRCHTFAEGVDAGLSEDNYLRLKQKIEVGSNEEARTT